MKNWLRQHYKSLASTLSRLARAPFATAMNVGVIGVALALPLGFYIGLTNLQQFAGGWSTVPQISLFLALDATRAQAEEIAKRLKQHPDVDKVRFVPREQALQELKASTGLTDVVDSLGRNPLPDALVVDARDATPSKLDAMREAFRALPRVAHVQLDSAWARRLAAAVDLGQMVVLMLGGLLAFALVAVTVNTIRLQILTQRDEVEVARLIGATDAFIRRPFLYYGTLLGLAGGMAGWMLVWGGLALLRPGMTELAGLYGIALDLRHLSIADSLSLLAFSAWLGWFGAWLSVGRHLGTPSTRR